MKPMKRFDKTDDLSLADEVNFFEKKIETHAKTHARTPSRPTSVRTPPDWNDPAVAKMSKRLAEMTDVLNEDEQRLFIQSFRMYLNYDEEKRVSGFPRPLEVVKKSP